MHPAAHLLRLISRRYPGRHRRRSPALVLLAGALTPVVRECRDGQDDDALLDVHLTPAVQHLVPVVQAVGVVTHPGVG
jgi:hypothetical protein